MKIKSNIALCFLTLFLAVFLFCACGGTKIPNLTPEDQENLPNDQTQLPTPDGSEAPDGSTPNTAPDGSQNNPDPPSGSELPPDSDLDPKPDPNAGIVLSQNELILNVGQTTTLTATVTPLFPTDPTTPVFSVSDDTVADVDQNGKVTAKSEGKVLISVTCKTLSANCSLTVKDDRNENPGITVKSDSLRILRGQSAPVGASFVPPRVGDDTTLYYSSSAESVASVTKDGKINALSSGVAIITVSDSSGSYQKKVTVSVPQSFSFLAAGDNLLHSGIYNDARERAGGSGYDFLPIYSAIADKVAGADFAMINQEGVFSGSGISSYPKLNAPQEGIKALADLGFDIISLANNHCLDMGGSGLAKSMTYLDTLKGVIRLGGYFKKNNDALKTRVIEKDGIKVALLAYTTFTNGDIPSDYNSSGVYVPWVEPYENTIDDIKRAKTKADAVLVFMHWGDEEKFAVTNRQREIAKMLADNGVDVIVGAHPHVIQPVEYIEAEDGRRVPCIYSLGTLVSNMMTEQNMLSCLATFDFIKDPASGKISVENIEMDPYVFYYNMNYRESALYRLPDLTDALAKSHGIGNYPKDSSVKNTMSISRLYGYLRDHIDPAFLPEDIQKELSN